MVRGRLFQYKNIYTVAMKPFGLQRGVVGSTTHHKSDRQYYRGVMLQYEQDIEKLQAEVEKSWNGIRGYFKSEESEYPEWCNML